MATHGNRGAVAARCHRAGAFVAVRVRLIIGVGASRLRSVLVWQVQQTAPLRLGVASAKEAEIKGRRAALASVIHGTVDVDGTLDALPSAEGRDTDPQPPARGPSAKATDPSLASRLAKSQKDQEEFYQRSLTEQGLVDLEVRLPRMLPPRRDTNVAHHLPLCCRRRSGGRILRTSDPLARTAHVSIDCGVHHLSASPCWTRRGADRGREAALQ